MKRNATAETSVKTETEYFESLESAHLDMMYENALNARDAAQLIVDQIQVMRFEIQQTRIQTLRRGQGEINLETGYDPNLNAHKQRLS